VIKHNLRKVVIRVLTKPSNRLYKIINFLQKKGYLNFSFKGFKRAQNFILKISSLVFRNLPCNNNINKLAVELSLLFKNAHPEFTFYCEKIGVNWSTAGFPDLLTREMMFTGLYQENVLVSIKNLVKPGEVIFDVGGHHGLMAIVGAKAVGANGKVISFDPNPDVNKYIYNHLKINGLKNVSFEQLGLLDEEGFFDFYKQIGTISWNSSFVREFVESHSEIAQISVKATTLDNYVKNTGVIPRLIKIDTEGTEIRILKGGLDLIKYNKPILILELNSKAASKANTTLANIIHFLQKLSYEVFSLKKDEFGRFDFLNRELFDEEKLQFVEKNKKIANVVCVPKMS